MTNSWIWNHLSGFDQMKTLSLNWHTENFHSKTSLKIPIFLQTSQNASIWTQASKIFWTPAIRGSMSRMSSKSRNMRLSSQMVTTRMMIWDNLTEMEGVRLIRLNMRVKTKVNLHKSFEARKLTLLDIFLFQRCQTTEPWLRTDRDLCHKSTLEDWRQALWRNLTDLKHNCRRSKRRMKKKRTWVSKRW